LEHKLTPANTDPRLALLWAEEFEQAEGTGVNKDHWNHDIGDGTAAGIPGWGNQEREYYLESAVVQDGNSNLTINATRMPAENEYDCYYGTPAEWTSGKITTYNKVGFKFGRLEARIKMPKGVGTWPAFWMLGAKIAEETWPHCGEIDIFEGKGADPRAVFGTLHGPGYFGENPHGKIIQAEKDLCDDFNVFAIEWSENKVEWFMNDEKFFSATNEDVAPSKWVYNQEFYLILNLAMGGHFTGPIADDLQSAQLSVDWIRFYSVDGVGELILH
jgi:beta-glucanase (GH16 family)